eukprot:6102526-Pleurochrysis_carterae.AAC.2
MQKYQPCRHKAAGFQGCCGWAEASASLGAAVDDWSAAAAEAAAEWSLSMLAVAAVGAAAAAPAAAASVAAGAHLHISAHALSVPDLPEAELLFLSWPRVRLLRHASFGLQAYKTALEAARGRRSRGARRDEGLR